MRRQPDCRLPLGAIVLRSRLRLRLSSLELAAVELGSRSDAASESLGWLAGWLSAGGESRARSGAFVTGRATSG